MTFFPATLSKTLRQELGDETQYQNNSTLVQKLNAKNLIVFFQQATQSHAWCQANASLVSTLFCAITDNVLNQVLPWNDALQACTYIFKYNYKGRNTIESNDFTLHFLDGSKSKSYSRLVMMRASPVLKKWWMDNPNQQFALLLTFAKSLKTTEEFDLLYSTFITDDFSAGHNASMLCLQRVMMQSREWGYTRGSIEFQKIFLGHLGDFTSIIGEYALAVYNDLNLLRAFCENYLDNLEFSVCTTLTDLDCYTVYNLKVNDTTLKKTLTNPDIISLSQSYLQYQGNITVFDVMGERVDIIFLDKSTAIMGLRKLRNVAEVNTARSNVEAHPKRKIERNRIRRLIADGTFQLPDISIIGMLVYFNKIEALDFNNYSQINDGIFDRLAEVKPNLRGLRFNECLNLSEETVKCIPHRFPSLVVLHLSVTNITSYLLNLLFEMPCLKELSFTKCTLKLPDNLVNFNRLTKVEFVDITSLSIDETSKLFRNCTNVTSLSVVKMNHFDLMKYPYPEKLMEVTLSCDYLEKYIVYIDKMPVISILKKFPNLERIILKGSPSSALKEVIVKFLSSKMTEVKFVKSDRITYT